MAKMSSTAENMSRRLKDAAKEPGLVPCGVWELRATASLKLSDGEDKQGKAYKCVLAVHEPYRATDSVDPDEVEAIDPDTGKSTYDGKRLYTRFYLPRDSRRFAQFLLAHGEDEDMTLEGEFGLPSDETLEEFKGKVALGNVGIRPAKDQYPADSQVKTWALAE